MFSLIGRRLFSFPHCLADKKIQYNRRVNQSIQNLQTFCSKNITAHEQMP